MSDEKNNLHKFGTALLSLKGKEGYPHLIPIKYLRKNNRIYISRKEDVFELPEIEYGSSISYSIIGYEQIIPIQLDDSPDSLFVIDLADKGENTDMQVTYNSFINQFSEGRVEVGIGIIEKYEGYDNILSIDVERSSLDMDL